MNLREKRRIQKKIVQRKIIRLNEGPVAVLKQTHSFKTIY